MFNKQDIPKIGWFLCEHKFVANTVVEILSVYLKQKKKKKLSQFPNGQNRKKATALYQTHHHIRMIKCKRI